MIEPRRRPSMSSGSTSAREYMAGGERTRIRAFTRRDVDSWQAWPRHPNPLYSPFNPIGMSGPLRDAWYEDLVQRQAQIPFAVDDLAGRMIGRIFLRFVNRVDGGSVLGIDFDPLYVGHGYGTDALRAFMGYYFGPLGFRRLLLSVASYNERARRSYERCGFQYLATHWERLKCEADIFGDERYRELRPLFRRGRAGLEALFHTMEAKRRAGPRKGEPTSGPVAAPG
jgi:RimJ/RimL family protein N-acetyltransferase